MESIRHEKLRKLALAICAHSMRPWQRTAELRLALAVLAILSPDARGALVRFWRAGDLRNHRERLAVQESALAEIRAAPVSAPEVAAE